MEEKVPDNRTALEKVEDIITMAKNQNIPRIYWEDEDWPVLKEFVEKNGFEFKGNVFWGIEHFHGRNFSAD